MNMVQLLKYVSLFNVDSIGNLLKLWLPVQSVIYIGFTGIYRKPENLIITDNKSSTY